MRKRSALVIETTRPKPLSKLITVPVQKIQQDKYNQTTSPTDSTVGTQESTAAFPTATEIDPLNPPATDDIISGTTMYERLSLSGGEYCPTLPPQFYRRVWFDGLEAFESFHFSVDLGNGCIIPYTTLSTDTIVTASYVKA